MKYSTVPKERFNDVLIHFRDYFFPEEPLNKAVDVCKPGQGLTEFLNDCLSCLEEGLCVMAVTPEGEIAGVSLNKGVEPGFIEKVTEQIESFGPIGIQKVYKMLYTYGTKPDYFTEFNVDKFLEIFLISVEPKFRFQGIGTKLLLKSEELAREKGFQLIKADATSYYSQNIMKKIDYKALQEVLYDEVLDENNEKIFDIGPPHTKMIIFVKVLD